VFAARICWPAGRPACQSGRVALWSLLGPARGADSLPLYMGERPHCALVCPQAINLAGRPPASALMQMGRAPRWASTFARLI